RSGRRLPVLRRCTFHPVLRPAIPAPRPALPACVVLPRFPPAPHSIPNPPRHTSSATPIPVLRLYCTQFVLLGPRPYARLHTQRLEILIRKRLILQRIHNPRVVHDLEI